ncbi:FAD-dependent monooxygenase [Rhizobium sp. NRK18]|uniref:FAD-dependent monooxygenase n=1 Tax=Rhizobium sp. NRK18 TaxID=2964667 RepID=UPI0021C2C621|nr:FAD-dependent monooxygenase [Rhizobium sp. NRK18]MCQ2004321.1 FAD-dependent monooxygenase [Rhizobium sp. NRK18]
MTIKSVLIAGAGIAGLTAALAMARAGISSRIIEQAVDLQEVGAGLQISPNASRLLADVGVLSRLESVWLEPEAINLVSGQSLATLASVPLGAAGRRRWGAPYGVLHRATLQKALVEAVRDNTLCRLELGHRLEPETLEAAMAESGAALLIGADGVWSRVRSRVPGAPVPRFSGNVAWRFVVPADQAPEVLRRDSVTALLGPSAHLVCYPLKEAGGFNLVAITSGINPGETWNAPSDPAGRALMESAFRSWHGTIRKLLGDAERPVFWPLNEVGSGRWQNGVDTVLIGDAAHAMMPFAAQGAAMAIEDAFELAALVARLQPVPALATFESRRRERATKLSRRAAFNKFAYHATGPVRIGRDLILSMRSPQSLAGDLDWIYGYRIGG